MSFIDSSGRELVDVGGADITVDLGSVQIEDPTVTSQKMAVDSHKSAQVRLADSTGTDVAGAGGTGLTQPTGGSGILGWLSGCYSKLTAIATSVGGTLTVGLPTGASQDGTDINAPTAMPAGGAGIRGWLSAIWTKLNGSIAVTGTFWQATQPVSGTVTTNSGDAAGTAHSADASFNEPTTGTGAVGYLSGIYQRIKDMRTSLAGTLTVIAPTTAPLFNQATPRHPSPRTPSTPSTASSCLPRPPASATS